MKEQIIKNIERLSLHDSHIGGIIRNKNKMILNLDWAKLNGYSESNINEGLILGKCELIFNGFNEEKLILDLREFLEKKI